MARRNNKGFSLIEIVIAMAVLTLLLTPIIKQFAQTMKVSRQAKQQQYINEEASYSLEEAQVTPTKEYEQKYLDYVAANPEYTFATGTDSTTCILVDSTGNEYSIVDSNGNKFKNSVGTDINAVTYTVESYTLGNLEIGYNNAVYDRVVTVDNLATQVRGCKNELNGNGFKIKYNMTEAELPTEEYSLTSEGSAVKRDGSGNVTAIVVEETPFVGNPNDTNLGNMQNLDYESVAMINGTATNFDDMADKALFSKAMDKLKEYKYADWEQAMFHVAGDNILKQTYGYQPVISKLTKIYVDKGTDDSGKDYYIVKCDVYYNCDDGMSIGESEVYDGKEQFTYNVFTQKFYTETCPDIYFQYQPYVKNYVEENGAYDITYASDDYILIDSYVEGVKLYLYKPYMDAVSVTGGAKLENYSQEENYTYTTRKPTSEEESAANIDNFLLDNKVKIHIVKDNSDVKDVNIFTNLDTEVRGDLGEKSQFFVDAEHEGVKTFKSVKSDKIGYDEADLVNYDRSLILPIDADTRYDDRLRTVTVTMLPIQTDSNGNAVLDVNGVKQVNEHANKVVLSGAKGEK